MHGSLRLRATIVISLLAGLLFTYGCSRTSASDQGAITSGTTNTVGDTAAVVVVESNQSLPTAPHLFDVYRATNANTAILFLHGAGGNKHHAAYQFGVNLSDVDSDYGTVNEAALLANKALAIFPQGQALPAAPEAFTWSNYVTDSGQDDMAFIRELVAYIQTKYGISRFSIVGHSSGGMMANRIWCEDPELFNKYIAIGGPPSEQFLNPSTPCSPSDAKPYLGIIRMDDKVLGVSGNWDAPTWTINQAFMLPHEAFVDSVVIGERDFLKSRVAKRCGADVPAGDMSAITDGSITTWSFCDDSIRLLRVESNQGLDALQSAVWKFLSPS